MAKIDPFVTFGIFRFNGKVRVHGVTVLIEVVNDRISDVYVWKGMHVVTGAKAYKAIRAAIRSLRIAGYIR